MADVYAEEVVPWGEHCAGIALDLADMQAPAHIGGRRDVSDPGPVRTL